MTQNTINIELSIIIPVFNEQEALNICYLELKKVFYHLENRIEFIFIDDGSKDKTSEIMKEISYHDMSVKCIFLSRNFGKESAMSAGLDFANGYFVAQIDVDLQDPPELIPKMIEVLKQTQSDVVYGVRSEREGESSIKKLSSYLFYKIIDKMTHIDIPRNTGDFRVMTREVILALRSLNETQRFMKGLFAWVGFKQIAFPYKRKARIAGKTKFNYIKLWNFALEGITSFTNMPLKTATYFGFCISTVSFLLSLFYISKYFFYGEKIQGFLTLIVAILFMGGIQLMFLGILGEYLGRTYIESKRRPVYLIRKKLNLD
ncbi:glycosyltransferase family 2 protein [Fluviispira multicolorata]|uniref:Glycosyltransferase n=1 Tax=Fluviispira multicolorata TaxID=2654512 RepID=A0A833N7D1_9BACT|nr:glycosyltransferase family 2 protein [Fluviispira multicolorata]KAB8032050.1 glycosyltransferase [Fluviispira multicolorata]